MSVLPIEVSSLSIGEKFELLDALWEDLEMQAPMLNAEQSAELDVRMTHYQQDPSSVIAWEQIRADLLER